MADDSAQPESRTGGNVPFIQRENGPRPPYAGQGTPSDPYVVEYLERDPANPQNFSTTRKWFYTSIMIISVFAATFASAAYSPSTPEIITEFNTNNDWVAAGISFYVLGFALGPAIWAPLSELYGRRPVFNISLCATTACIGAGAGCKNMASLLVFRFLAGTFGASPLVNSGGVISDLWPQSRIGIAMSVFSASPMLGPILGPVIGGFVTMMVGWRWVQGICCIFVGLVWIGGASMLPETYGPVILRKMADQLSKTTGKRYSSLIDKETRGVHASQAFNKVLTRPWVLLIWEPIVLIAAVYLAILYATIYMFLAAYPIIYQEERGWNVGMGNLPFVGEIVGMMVAVIYLICDDIYRYQPLGENITPESRLLPGLVGAVCLPIGMFGFAWTTYSSVHWAFGIVLSSFFGLGCLLVFVSILVYLLDSYMFYAASALAATSILRALVAAAFPMFTRRMYLNLGLQWAGSVPAFLTLACLPFPFVMYKYGGRIRHKCKYAHEAAVLLSTLQEVRRSEI